MIYRMPGKKCCFEPIFSRSLSVSPRAILLLPPLFRFSLRHRRKNNMLADSFYVRVPHSMDIFYFCLAAVDVRSARCSWTWLKSMVAHTRPTKTLSINDDDEWSTGASAMAVRWAREISPSLRKKTKKSQFNWMKRFFYFRRARRRLAGNGCAPESQIITTTRRRRFLFVVVAVFFSPGAFPVHNTQLIWVSIKWNDSLRPTVSNVQWHEILFLHRVRWNNGLVMKSPNKLITGFFFRLPRRRKQIQLWEFSKIIRHTLITDYSSHSCALAHVHTNHSRPCEREKSESHNAPRNAPRGRKRQFWWNNWW